MGRRQYRAIFLCAVGYLIGSCVFPPKHPIVEVPGSIYESGEIQELRYEMIQDVVGKIAQEVPKEGRLAVVQIARCESHDMVADLLFERLKQEGRDVIKVEERELDDVLSGLTYYTVAYPTEISAKSDSKEIPQSLIDAAGTPPSCCLFPCSVPRFCIANIGLAGSLTEDLGRKVGGEIKIYVRTVKIPDKIVLSKEYRGVRAKEF